MKENLNIKSQRMISGNPFGKLISSSPLPITRILNLHWRRLIVADYQPVENKKIRRGVG